MANVTFDLQWKEGMVELLDQLELLDPLSSAEAKARLGSLDPSEQFQHFATLYIRYLQIFRKLEESYDQMVHPQKRIDIRKSLDGVMGRLLEVREILVEKNKGINYINLDDVLVDLKLSPEELEVPVPKYFVESQAKALTEREKLLDALLEQNPNLRDNEDEDPFDSMSVDQALQIIQINERGRQAMQRAKFMRMIREQEAREKQRLHMGDADRDPDVAAIDMQRMWRGYSTRKKTEIMRAEELIFIGMAPPMPHPREADPILIELEDKRRRKQVQAQYNEEYGRALVALDKQVYDNEGPDMKEEMIDQLRDWYIKYREREGKFPDFPPEEVVKPSADEMAAAAANGKDAKKDPKKDDKGKKDAKGKGAEVSEPPPPLPPHFMNTMKDSFQEWSDKWQHRDESNNFAQKHDVELVKQMVRPDVELRVRAEVNEMIAKELANLQAAFERDVKAKKGKGGKKGGKKGKKGKKGGKGGKKGKKGPKDPTASSSIEYLYQLLVGEGILKKVKKTSIQDFVGSYAFLGQAMDKLAEVEPTRLPDPSFAQIRSAVTEYCILPIGSEEVKRHAPLNTYVKGSKRVDRNGTPVLLVGTHGSGKKMLAHAIASETGANLFDLTPSNTEGKYPGKKGPYDMVHTVLKVAKALPPSVVLIGESESVWTSGKKKGGGEPPNRILKQLMTLLAPKKGPALLEPSDRVLILCTSSQPYACEKAKDYNAYKDFFAKILYLPLPDYAARTKLWMHLLEKAGVARPDPDEIQTLARVSDTYSSGSIANVVKRTLTPQRLERLPKRPFSINELVGQLAKEEPVYFNVDSDMRRWYHKTLGIGLPEGEGKPKQEKKGGGKGKKGK